MGKRVSNRGRRRVIQASKSSYLRERETEPSEVSPVSPIEMILGRLGLRTTLSRKIASVIGIFALVVTAVIATSDLANVIARVGIPLGVLLAILVVAILSKRQGAGGRRAQNVVFAVILIGGFVVAGSAIWLSTSREQQQAVSQIADGAANGLALNDTAIQNENFDGKDLSYSKLQDSVFTDVSFVGANLDQSDMRGARFDSVDFSGANLCATDFRGADLRGALNLADVNSFRYFIYDDSTRFPDGFSIESIEGPVVVNDSSRKTILYSCDQKVTRRMELSTQ